MTADLEALAQEAAEIIVSAGAVYTRTSGDPFFFSSGWASPIFIDIKRLISLPQARSRLIEISIAVIQKRVGFETFELVAGCELAGVPYAAVIADRLRLPLVLVRKQGKGFGRLAQFEGAFEPEVRALLVDDLSTDGVNKQTFRSAMERAQATVVATFVMLDYRVFSGSGALVSVMTLDHVIARGEESGFLSGQRLKEVKAFAADAAGWSRRNGGIGALDRSAPPAQ